MRRYRLASWNTCKLPKRDYQGMPRVGRSAYDRRIVIRVAANWVAASVPAVVSVLRTPPL